MLSIHMKIGGCGNGVSVKGDNHAMDVGNSSMRMCVAGPTMDE